MGIANEGARLLMIALEMPIMRIQTILARVSQLDF